MPPWQAHGSSMAPFQGNGNGHSAPHPGAADAMQKLLLAGKKAEALRCFPTYASKLPPDTHRDRQQDSKNPLAFCQRIVLHDVGEPLIEISWVILRAVQLIWTLSGDRTAVECGLWGPALILARAAGDAAYAETVAAMAAATAGPGSPLSSLLLMLAGGHELVLPAKPSARGSPAKAASGSSFNLKGLLNKSASKVSLTKAPERCVSVRGAGSYHAFKGC